MRPLSAHLWAKPLTASVLAALLLTGCGGDGEATNASPDTSAAVGTAPQVPMPPPEYYVPGENPIVGEMPGTNPADVVEAGEGDVLSERPAALPGGLHAFPLPSGDYLVLDPTRPLPEPVRDAVTERAASTLPIVSRSGDLQTEVANDAALTEFSTWVDETTGKPVVVVKPGPPQPGADSSAVVPTWTAWLLDHETGSKASFNKLSSGDAKKAAEEWILAAGNDPATYLFVEL